MICQFCSEPITEAEQELSTPKFGGAALHLECGFRAMLGSLAHLNHSCGCYVAGSTAGDPEDMTPRQAAKLAYAYWTWLSNEQRQAVMEAAPAADDMPPPITDLLQ